MSLKRFFLGTHRLKPLHIDLNGSPDRLAAALHGLAHMVHRRHDLDGQRIRITIVVRDRLDDR
ncbi:hypothetical protein [Micromonospora narathiwatensis]|uniref:Uncharacterized protein n=1 Tax=Micromonospora narathiwatensis TaxID=299146 RepID=A0A1A9A624_9ACTN|nr:hypothetical protein [Micromonospora narathiwatensis]SBT51644.1 hypothetical protein GA0070621_4132 [Micromonospora narathiwatensis]